MLKALGNEWTLPGLKSGRRKWAALFEWSRDVTNDFYRRLSPKNQPVRKTPSDNQGTDQSEGWAYDRCLKQPDCRCGRDLPAGQRTAFRKETQASPTTSESLSTVNRESRAVRCGVNTLIKKLQNFYRDQRADCLTYKDIQICPYAALLRDEGKELVVRVPVGILLRGDAGREGRLNIGARCPL